MSDQQPPQGSNPGAEGEQPQQPAPQPPVSPAQPPVPPPPPVQPTYQQQVPPPPPPPPASQPYGQPFGAQPNPQMQYAPMAVPQTNTSAIVAFVLSLVSWFICPIIAAIVALVFASKAKKEIEASGGWQTGDGFVTAAKIISWINIVFMALVFVFYIVIIIIAIAAGSTNPGPYATPNDIYGVLGLW